jgi:hypothetical protein
MKVERIFNIRSAEAFQDDELNFIQWIDEKTKG